MFSCKKQSMTKKKTLRQPTLVTRLSLTLAPSSSKAASCSTKASATSTISAVTQVQMAPWPQVHLKIFDVGGIKQCIVQSDV